MPPVTVSNFARLPNFTRIPNFVRPRNPPALDAGAPSPLQILGNATDSVQLIEGAGAVFIIEDTARFILIRNTVAFALIRIPVFLSLQLDGKPVVRRLTVHNVGPEEVNLDAIDALVDGSLIAMPAGFSTEVTGVPTPIGTAVTQYVSSFVL